MYVSDYARSDCLLILIRARSQIQTLLRRKRLVIRTDQFANGRQQFIHINASDKNGEQIINIES